MNRPIPKPAVPKRRRNSYGRDGSFVANDDDTGDEVDPIRTEPSTKRIRIKRTANAYLQVQIEAS
jgi:hypothetical protein